MRAQKPRYGCRVQLGYRGTVAYAILRIYRHAASRANGSTGNPVGKKVKGLKPDK